MDTGVIDAAMKGRVPLASSVERGIRSFVFHTLPFEGKGAIVPLEHRFRHTCKIRK